MTPSPLNRLYLYRPGIGLLAKYADDPDQECQWQVSKVPGLRWAMETPGEVEAMVAARDAAVDARRENERCRE